MTRLISNVRVLLCITRKFVISLTRDRDDRQRYIAERTAAALSNSCSGHRSSLNESTSKNNSGIKLDLPCFTGDVLKFMTYWDQFKCAVHENQELSEVQKFIYLRSTLKGSALHAIKGFEVTVANYKHAVAAILHRFGRKRIIVASLVKSIIKLEMKEIVNAASLRDLHDTFSKSYQSTRGFRL